MSGYVVLSLEEIEPVPYHAREGERLLTVERLLGYRAAGINAWLGDPGETLVPEHNEDTEEELYVVVQGHAAFTVDGQAVDAPAGTLVHVTAREVRTAVATEPRTIVVAVGGTPGFAYAPGGWTSWVVADALQREGRLDEARAAIRQMLDLYPDAWSAPYNAACFEARAGNPDGAFHHLDRALQLDADAVRHQAAGDEDLAPLHDDPRWEPLRT
jgi:mannose-6-phosphate isomerase-like protein (cupin superfamily)